MKEYVTGLESSARSQERAATEERAEAGALPSVTKTAKAESRSENTENANPQTSQKRFKREEPHYTPGIRGWWRKKSDQINQNIDSVSFYARLKDGYKILGLIGPILGAAIPWRAVEGNKPKDALFGDSKYIDENRQKLIDSMEKNQGDDRSRWEYVANIQKGMLNYRENKSRLEPNYKFNKLRKNLIGDTLHFLLQFAMSGIVTTYEKNTVVRTYEKLVKEELNISGSVSFADMKRSQNPIVQQATEYYSKKSLYRYLPDFLGLVRWVPFVYFNAIRNRNGVGELHTGKDGWGDPEKRNPKGFSKLLDKIMWGTAEFVDGISLLLGAKTGFFAWYFMKRQTGSFYVAEDLWNKTEGTEMPNRHFNKQTLANEFVTQHEIARLYEKFRGENPELDLATFTRDDPLSTRIFEQVARYLNHTYMPKLFATNEPEKQWDLKNKKLSHAMLIEYVGNGGLQVNDALGSVLKLEVMAYYGGLNLSDEPKNPNQNLKLAIEQFRKVSAEIDKIRHPYPKEYGNFDNPRELQRAVKDVHNYFAALEDIGKRYLGNDWPPRYVYRELKKGFIQYFFQKSLSREQKLSEADLLYISNAMSTIPAGVNEFEYFKQYKYEMAPYPSSVIFSNERTAMGEASQQKEAQYYRDNQTSLEEELLSREREDPQAEKKVDKPREHGNSEVDFADKPKGVKLFANQESQRSITKHSEHIKPKERTERMARSTTDYAAREEDSALSMVGV